MTNVIIFILVGIAAGILSGMFGIGGGIIIVPALMYFADFSQLKAQGTSLAILLPPVGILAFIEYYKKGYVDVKAGVLICVFLVVGAALGARIAHVLPVTVMKKGFGILMLFISIKMLLSK